MSTLQGYPMGQNYVETALSCTVFVFCDFCEISKIQNGRHIGRDKNFLKIGMATPERYTVGHKCRNRSI